MDSARKELIVDDPYVDWESELMQFRLTYEGPLLSDTTKGEKVAGRAKHKQEIRKAFHPQLRRLWQVHPILSQELGDIADANFLITESKAIPHKIDDLAANFPRNGYNFVPLVTRAIGLHCALDILFLRNEAPGNILHKGDIDNRVKTLVDGLKMPRSQGEMGGYDAPSDDEKPFFCLLEDDSLITRFSVEADTLLQPLYGTVNNNDARVVITVTLKPYVTTVFNQVFG
ncbi:hypothetical protein [Sphingomonas sp.]|uniref:hypothetical protein n=1 Tax=Sphingomonas sp. TaxID=28214 RepID=UPI0038AF6847